jgi:retinol dehydrogenase 12
MPVPWAPNRCRQGHELTIGINCVGTFLFTELLTPLLQATAKRSLPATNAVLETAGVEGEGVVLDNIAYDPAGKGGVSKAIDRYAVSKAGIWALGAVFRFMVSPLCYLSPLGVSTMAFASTSPEVTLEESSSWIIPFGRIYPLKSTLVSATKPGSEGGTGGVARFWDWNEEQVKGFL